MLTVTTNPTVITEVVQAHIITETVNNFVTEETIEQPVYQTYVISGNAPPIPPPVTATFIYTQNTASTVWTINHNLNKYPSVDVVDSAGTVVIGDVNYVSDNQVVVSFSAPFTGSAYLN